GETLPEVIVDIARPPGPSEPARTYVMLSRVKASDLYASFVISIWTLAKPTTAMVTENAPLEAIVLKTEAEHAPYLVCWLVARLFTFPKIRTKEFRLSFYQVIISFNGKVQISTRSYSSFPVEQGFMGAVSTASLTCDYRTRI